MRPNITQSEINSKFYLKCEIKFYLQSFPSSTSQYLSVLKSTQVPPIPKKSPVSLMYILGGSNEVIEMNLS